jgi:hypothetical protein
LIGIKDYGSFGGIVIRVWLGFWGFVGLKKSKCSEVLLSHVLKKAVLTGENVIKNFLIKLHVWGPDLIFFILKKLVFVGRFSTFKTCGFYKFLEMQPTPDIRHPSGPA